MATSRRVINAPLCLVLLALIGACAAQAPFVGIGDRLLHTYFEWRPLPLNTSTLLSLLARSSSRIRMSLLYIFPRRRGEI